MKQRVLISFTRYTESVIITVVTAIIASLTGNAYYPTIFPTIATIQAALDAYQVALDGAQSRDRFKIAIKNDRRKTLNSLMKQLAQHINSVANGNLPMLASTAMELSKLPAPRHLEAPEMPRVTVGINPGWLVSKIKAPKGVIGYMHQLLALDAPEGTEWTSFTTSRGKYTYTGLKAGFGYRIRVVAMGSNEQLAYSPEVIFYAQ